MMKVKVHQEYVDTGFPCTMQANLHLFAHSINFPAFKSINRIKTVPVGSPVDFYTFIEALGC
jgi:hypothetical protein